MQVMKYVPVSETVLFLFKPFQSLKLQTLITQNCATFLTHLNTLYTNSKIVLYSRHFVHINLCHNKTF